MPRTHAAAAPQNQPTKNQRPPATTRFVMSAGWTVARSFALVRESGPSHRSYRRTPIRSVYSPRAGTGHRAVSQKRCFQAHLATGERSQIVFESSAERLGALGWPKFRRHPVLLDYPKTQNGQASTLGRKTMIWRSSRRARLRGQALVEFALVLPVLVLILGGIMQFGLVFWAQNTLTQVVRDTGRWAATQQTRPCDSGGVALVAKADQIAANSSLLGYSAGEWTSIGTPPGTPAAFNVSPAPREGLEASWPISTDLPGLVNTDCPPDTNGTAWFVNIRAHHEVPLFFPFIGSFIPSCNSATCSLSSSVQFRMEPAQ